MADPTPDSARRFVKTVADLYGEATIVLLRAIATRMAAGLDATDGQRTKLADILALREQSRAVAARLSDTLDTTLTEVIGQAYDHGADQGAENLAQALGFRDNVADRAALRGLTATKQGTVEALGRALSGTLRDLPILRATDDAYRAAVAAAAVPSSTGVEARRLATQRALDRLAMAGIGAFTDKSGRVWRLDTYADMATRTTVAQAAVQGSVDRIRATTPFVRVSDTADECELCRPFEGKVLLIVAPSQVPEKWADVPYDGTLRDATSRGLFHPNCTHGLGAFIPGLTRTNTQRPATANPEGYADRQRQRALERHVREWKRREAVAITPEAQRKAAGKVQAYQQAIADHVARTGANRRSDRESIRAGSDAPPRPLLSREAPDGAMVPAPLPAESLGVGRAGLTARNVRHIIDGEPDVRSRGGHAAGTGRPNKTEFPPGWSRGQIEAATYDVMNSPQWVRVVGVWEVRRGLVDGVIIEVKTKRTRKRSVFIEAFPVSGDGVVHNNSDGTRAARPLDLRGLTPVSPRK